MILIIAEKDDIPSLRLIHLLTKNNIKYYFLCIDEEDPLIHINIETNDIFINDVDYREYKAQFSKPMQKISSIGIIPEDDILQLPIDKDNIHWATPYTYVMPLREPLKSDSKYGYRVKTWFSDATYHFKMQNYYDLIFETK